MDVARDIRNCPGHPYVAMAHRAVTFAIAWLSCFLCVCVCLSMLSWLHFKTDFDELWHRRLNLKRKNPFVGYPLTVFPIVTQF